MDGRTDAQNSYITITHKALFTVWHDGIAECFLNKCVGDDTKAAARQSLNCIKNKKIKYGENSKCRVEFLHPAMWHDHDIDFVR